MFLLLPLFLFFSVTKQSELFTMPTGFTVTLAISLNKIPIPISIPFLSSIPFSMGDRRHSSFGWSLLKYIFSQRYILCPKVKVCDVFDFFRRAVFSVFSVVITTAVAVYVTVTSWFLPIHKYIRLFSSTLLTAYLHFVRVRNKQ